jgi:hypothetical protein
MPYLISMLAAAAGVVVLLMMLVRLGGVARRLSDALRRSRTQFAARTRVLAVQIAALRLALDERRHRNTEGPRPSPAA